VRQQGAAENLYKRVSALLKLKYTIMKNLKFSVTAIAFAMAIGSVIAREVHFKPLVTFQWHKYSGSTSSPTITTVTDTDAHAQSICAGGAYNCMVRLDDQGVETAIVYQRPQQP
jgi:hypothetical protein